VKSAQVKPVKEAHAEENRLISEWVASRAVTGDPGNIDMIGNLTGAPYCPKVILLTNEQKRVIMKLNELVRACRYRSMMADAAPYDGPPEVRKRQLAHNQTRRHDAIHHAQQVTILGLLTEDQSSRVIQAYLKSCGVGTINNDSIGIAERIELTASQMRILREVNAKFMARYTSDRAFEMSPDPKANEVYRKATDDWSQEYKQAIWEILTPAQQSVWSRLIAERTSPAELPNLSPSPASDAEAARIDREVVSHTFSVLDAQGDAFGLSAEQKALLKDLEQVTRQGLVWISLGKSDQTLQLRSRFMKHAEQVALLGILTEQQAEEAQVMMKK
jgi:hypothetical protein